MPTEIDALPTAPAATDSTSVFNSRAFAWVAALAAFRTQTNAVATEVYDAYTEAIAAQATAIAAANYAGLWTSLTGAKNVPLMTRHNDTFWILLQNVADVTTQTPQAGSSYWAPAYGIVQPLPDVAPTLLADWANSRYLDHRWSFTRASTAWTINEKGLAVQVNAGVPRFWHDITTRQCYGLLGEFTRTNNLLHNRDLTNAAWTKTNVTAVKNVTGIDGVASSASRITSTAGNGTCLQAIVSGSTTRKVTAYVYRITGSGTIQMTVDNGATWTAITVTSAWTRVDIPVQTLANPTVGFRIVTSGDAIGVDFVQQEDASDASSPIATTTVAVTRASESIQMLSTNFSNVFRSDELTLFVDAYHLGGLIGSAAVSNAVEISDGTTNNRFILRALRDTSAPKLTAIVTSGGGTQMTSAGVNITAGGRYLAALAVKTDDAAHYVNGVQEATDAGLTMPVSPTQIGLAAGAVAALDGVCVYSRVAVFPKRLSNTELAALTAV